MRIFLSSTANTNRQVQSTIQKFYSRKVKTTTDEIQLFEHRSYSSPLLFSIWAITIPLGAGLLFSISSLTACFMGEGRYLINISMSEEEIKFSTDIDKRASISDKGDTTDDVVMQKNIYGLRSAETTQRPM